MSSIKRIPLSSLMATRVGSINPASFPDEIFDLYSIPAFDSGRPEVILGRLIGSSKQEVKPGDVLLSKIVPHIRRCWIVGPSQGRRIIASGEWIVFRPSGDVDINYLRHFLTGDQFHAKFMNTVAGVGGSLLRARPAFVAQIEIPVPPLEEQERIARVLDRVDVLRDWRRKAMVHLDDLAEVTFVERFGDRTGTPIMFLGDQLEFVTSGGRGWAKYYSEHGARFIRSLDVRMNHIDNREAVFVEPPDNAEARRTRIRGGDVLLTITGSLIGRSAPVPEDFQGSYVSQHVAILRPRESSIRAQFLSYYLSLPFGGQRQIDKMQYGQTKPGLNFNQIREFSVPVPPISDQDSFLRVLAKISDVKKGYRDQLGALDSLFLSLHHSEFNRAILPESRMAN